MSRKREQKIRQRAQEIRKAWGINKIQAREIALAEWQELLGRLPGIRGGNDR
jgi:hypothetical protein